jgi:hypothetical protein
MPSLEDIDAYVAEIRVELPTGEWRRGSGYVIGPCRILTALHVIVGQEAVREGQIVSAPVSIEVRALGDFVERFGRKPDVSINRYIERVRAAAPDGDFLWRPAQLLWPSQGSEVPAYELAVLEVPPQLAAKHILKAPRIRCLKPNADLNCRGTGFPKWMTSQTSRGIDLSNPSAVRGTLTFGAPMNSSFHPFTATNGAPENSAEWSGLSGTAFFAAETSILVGIASAILPTFGNNGLWLTQVADLAEGAELQDFWTAAGLSRPSRVGAGVPLPYFPIDPCKYLHEFNREPQTNDIFDLFQPITNQPPKEFDPDELRQPLIFLISGRRKDLPSAMVQRIQEQIAPEFSGIRSGTPIPLAWDSDNDLERLVVGLQRSVARSVNSVSKLRLDDFSALSECAKGQDWTFEIDVSRCTERHVDALSRFLAAFATFKPSNRPPALYVKFTAGEADELAKNDAQIQAFLTLVKQRSSAFIDRVFLVEDIYLDDCDIQDIDNWGDSLQHYCEETANKCRDYLERVFRGANSYALRDVKDCLQSS